MLVTIGQIEGQVRCLPGRHERNELRRHAAVWFHLFKSLSDLLARPVPWSKRLNPRNREAISHHGYEFHHLGEQTRGPGWREVLRLGDIAGGQQLAYLRRGRNRSAE